MNAILFKILLIIIRIVLMLTKNAQFRVCTHNSTTTAKNRKRFTFRKRERKRELKMPNFKMGLGRRAAN